ncbi:glyoxalase domain containing 4 [Nesidiocoris tenuis]|uniref:Glyoxalase domain containing 4 n=2 Tax=Nesidiocoris tenuis TaxID=355587 RepID=A0ABN7B1C0_9HEMI|nr:glyoxalase domain containing 4 [Nesidiocoris tenuis]
MKVMIISKTDRDFSLFFGGHKPRLKYIQHDGEITLSPGHLCYVCPKAQLKMLSKSASSCCRESVVQPFCRVDYEGRESDYLLILKDPNHYPMYIFDEESFSQYSCMDPKSTVKWALSLAKEYGPNLNLDDIL